MRHEDENRRPLIVNQDGTENTEAEKKVAIGGSISMVTGFLASIATGIGLHIKLRPFDQEWSRRVREDLMSRSSGAIGSGLDSADIRKKHYLDMIMSGDHEFAKKLDNFGGRGTVAMLAGGAVGAVTAGAYWLANKNKIKQSSTTQAKNNSSIFYDGTVEGLIAENVAMKQQLNDKSDIKSPSDTLSNVSGQQLQAAMTPAR